MTNGETIARCEVLVSSSNGSYNCRNTFCSLFKRGRTTNDMERVAFLLIVWRNGEVALCGTKKELNEMNGRVMLQMIAPLNRSENDQLTGYIHSFKRIHS